MSTKIAIAGATLAFLATLGDQEGQDVVRSLVVDGDSDEPAEPWHKSETGPTQNPSKKPFLQQSKRDVYRQPRKYKR